MIICQKCVWKSNWPNVTTASDMSLPETKEKIVVVTEDSVFFALDLRQCYTMMDKPSEMDCSAHMACTSPTTPRPIHAIPPALLATLLPWKKEQNGRGSASCPFFFHPKPWLLVMMCVVQNNKPGHTRMAPGSATLMVTARK